MVAVLCSAWLGLVVVAPAQAFVYWTNTDTNTIGRANLDGTATKQTFITSAPVPVGVAVDGGHVYWTTYTNDTIGRANLDGTATNETFITVPNLGPNSQLPTGVAVDAGHIYWTDSYSNPNVGSQIGRANLDGAAADQSFITPGTGPYADDPVAAAVDAGHIYWANANAHGIGRANLDGTDANAFFIGGIVAGGVAVDTGHVYWTNPFIGTIGRANLDGTAVDQYFITGARFPHGVAIDAGHVYWTNDNPGAIGRANLDGTAANQDFIAGVVGPAGVAVDALPDVSAPSLSCAAADGAWHANNVSLACTASDSGSGLASSSDASFSLSTSVPAGTETANASTTSHEVCDSAGNCATAGPITANKIDRKAPTITLTAPPDGARYGVLATLFSPVHASYSCTDGGSGVASCTATQPNGSRIDTGLFTLGSPHTFTVTAKDNVGNTSSVSHRYTVGLL